MYQINSPLVQNIDGTAGAAPAIALSMDSRNAETVASSTQTYRNGTRMQSKCKPQPGAKQTWDLRS